MLEPILVDHATMFPSACVCGSQTGPLADTHIEVDGRRIYLCKLCSKMLARAFGFAPGEKMDELENAAALLRAKEQELGDVRSLADQLNESLSTEKQRAEQLRLEVDRVNGRIRQREHLADIIVSTAAELKAA